MVDIQVCTFPSCEKGAKARGLCGGHYQQELAGKPLTSLRQPAVRGICPEDNCGREVVYLGLCNTHNEQRKRGESLREIRVWKHADWYDNGHGYMVSSKMVDGKKITQLQRRVIMEKHLGRALRPKESVHHKNGDRKDNRLENLELWSTLQPSGQRTIDKLDWAREIIILYGPDEEKLREMTNDTGSPEL